MNGRIGENGQRFSRRCNSKSTPTDALSTLLSFERERTLRVEKGDQNQCTGALSRWLLHEAPRARRHQRASAPRRTHVGPTTRSHGSLSRRRGTRSRTSIHRRHWIRLERYHCRGKKARNKAGPRLIGRWGSGPTLRWSPLRARSTVEKERSTLFIPLRRAERIETTNFSLLFEPVELKNLRRFGVREECV
jgi:hypothetical protein